MEYLTDENIKRMVKESKPQLPEGYENYMDNLLNGLVKRRTITNGSIYKRGIAAALLCILLGTGGIYAASNYYTQRMESMEPEEIEKFNQDVQQSEEDADTFIRELSESERERMNVLKETYESEGRFPEKELLQVLEEKDIQKDVICFVASTSTFYLPEREMTDEELLELIDFNYKREYSVREENKHIKEEAENQRKEVTGIMEESKAVSLARDVVSSIYDIDTTDSEYEIGLSGDQDGYSYGIAFAFDNEVWQTVQVHLDAISGEIFEVRLSGEGIREERIIADEILFKDKYQMVKEFFEGKVLKQGEVKNIFLDYRVYEDNALVAGVGVYTFQMTDGSAYLLSYSVSKSLICKVVYTDDLSRYDMPPQQTSTAEKKLGISRIRVIMEGNAPFDKQ